jgi:dienelactone hydrolase
VDRKYQKSKVWLCCALALMLISAIAVSLIQTAGGAVKMKDLRWETSPGLEMSGLLFVPEGATAENKAPAVVVSHGMYNNREMQDANYVELSRRGFVVLSMDMYSHGWSDNVADVGTVATGMYQAAKMLAGLDYVDAARIGITGHSLGGMSANAAVQMDEAFGTGYIAAVLLNSADATYKSAETEDWANVYGGRDVGIVAPRYDEFFFADVDEAGQATPPRDFLKYANAQSFLNFGSAPAGEARAAETVYRETVDGGEALRVIYNPNITHPWSHFSKRSTTATIEFFDAALGAPNPIAATSQVWQWKEAFNFLGLIGFGIFLVPFTILMTRLRFFQSLATSKVVAIRETNRAGKAWFWGTLGAGAVFATLAYVPILTGLNSFTYSKDPWPQSSPYGVATWALACGLFTLAMLTAFYFLFLRKNNISLAERGVAMPWKQLGKTVLLALATVGAAYACVFLADYFFKADFRLWVLAVKAFPPGVIWVSLFPPLVFLLVFYIMASIAANSINFVKITKKGGEREWVNTALLAAFNVAPAVILLLVQYIGFFSSGFMAVPTGNMVLLWLIPLLVILPASTVISRKIYRVTNNPYLPGLINGVVITLIACSNTLTWT